MRSTQDRFFDFRETLKEIVDINHHDIKPRDHQELDPEYYGKLKLDAPIEESETLSSKSKSKLRDSVVTSGANFVKKPTLDITFSSFAEQDHILSR